MRSVGLKMLKNRLAEYVRLAASGETILVTDRDRVVAQLTPPDASRGATISDAVIADLVRSGLMRPALRPPGPPPASTPIMTLAELLAELDADRADR